MRVRESVGQRIPFSTIGAATAWSLGTLTGTGRIALAPVPYNPSCASGLLFGFFACPTYHVHYIEVEVDPHTHQ